MLKLTVVARDGEPTSGDKLFRFGESGGSIGRAEDNQLVLPDPQRHISSSHARIHCQGGEYYLTDTSVNGVYVNGSDVPVGKGGCVLLHHGDHLSIGAYELQVAVEEASGGEEDETSYLPMAAGGGEPAEVGAEICGGVEGGIDDFLSGSVGSSAEGAANPFPIDGAVPDELSLEDIIRGPSAGSGGGLMPEGDGGAFLDTLRIDSTTDGARSDHLPLQHHPYQSVEMVDDPELPSRFAAEAPRPGEETVPLHAAEAPPSAERVPDTPRPSPSRPIADGPVADPVTEANVPPQGGGALSAGERRLLDAFLQGAGGGCRIDEARAEETLRLAGALFREAAKGLMEGLMARAEFRREFRMDPTLLAARGNNPLKFSVDVDGAVAALLTRHGEGYLPPTDAVREGFADLQAHQIGISAGMHAALCELLRRFDPQRLQEGFDEQARRGFGNRRARYWELYLEYYRRFSGEFDDNLHEVIGRAFSEAYEARVNQLEQARGGAVHPYL